MTSTIRYRVTNCHFTLTIERETKKQHLLWKLTWSTYHVGQILRVQSNHVDDHWNFCCASTGQYFDSCAVLYLNQRHGIGDIIYTFVACDIGENTYRVFTLALQWRLGSAAHTKWAKEEKVARTPQPLYTSRFSYKKKWHGAD